ncbi:MAG: hypothetical protein ACFCUR_14180 [Rhodomicrobiaceae bacterium]
MAPKASATALICSLIMVTAAHADNCGREALAAVVSEASAELTAMTEANTRRFQDKLQQLKASQGWSDADYVSKATPFVKDEAIAGFDARHGELLEQVPNLSAPGRSVASLAGAAPAYAASTHDGCPMAEKLRGLMNDVVDNSRAKWAYMLGKVDQALEKTDRVAAGQ